MTTSTHHHQDRSPSSVWAFGVTAFAAVMLCTVGVLQVLAGLAAVLEDEVYVTGIQYAYEIDVTTWGWIHMVVGAVGFAVGLGLGTGQTWGQLGGVFLAVLGILTNFAFMPYYPFWSLLLIGFYVAVIWAVCHQWGHDRPAT